jgi:hypothetical protein
VKEIKGDLSILPFWATAERRNQMKKDFLFTLSAMAIFLLVALIGCGSGTSGSSSGGTGTLNLTLSDATGDYEAVYVTIDEVAVHYANDEEGEWRIVAYPEETYNLLDLVNGNFVQLGITELQAGQYTQVRLILGDTPDNGLNIQNQPHPSANYIILKSTQTTEDLKVPSETIKIVGGFLLETGIVKEIRVDFDAEKSVVKAGNSGKYILKPTTKLVEIEESAVVSGTVSDAGDDKSDPADDAPLGSAKVSLQQYDSALDLKDQVLSVHSTVTETDGYYSLAADAGVYNLVAYRPPYEDGNGNITDLPFEPQCRTIDIDAPVSYGENDFSLNQATETTTVTGLVRFVDGDDNELVTLSVRREIDCETNASPQQVQLAFEKIEFEDSIAAQAGASYSFVLPKLASGSYTIVAWTDSETQPPETFSDDTTIDFEFPSVTP